MKRSTNNKIITASCVLGNTMVLVIAYGFIYQPKSLIYFFIFVANALLFFLSFGYGPLARVFTWQVRQRGEHLLTEDVKNLEPRGIGLSIRFFKFLGLWVDADYNNSNRS